MTAEQESRLTQIVTKSDNSDSSEVKTSTRKKFKLNAILNEIEYLEDPSFLVMLEVMLCLF